MEVITSNILHLGVIASEDEFQRGVRWGERREATVICTGFTNLLNRIWESLRTSCSIPSRQSLMKCTHTCTNIKTTLLMYSGYACKTACSTNSNNPREHNMHCSVLDFDFLTSILNISCCLCVSNHKPPKK